MYTFFDRGDRSITLRPEGTAGVVRSLIEHGLKPKECSACGTRMFRYERPQAGRQRQFHQLGVEVLGSADPSGCGGDCDRYGYSAKPRAENLRLDLNSVGRRQTALPASTGRLLNALQR